MDRFVDHAKDADSKVSREIESLADVYIGKRTWYEKVGDWLYDTFCVDLANSNDAFRFFSDAVKWCTGQAGDWIESVRDYFKYGDGQYIYNMVMAGWRSLEPSPVWSLLSLLSLRPAYRHCHRCCRAFGYNGSRHDHHRQQCVQNDFQL